MIEGGDKLILKSAYDIDSQSGGGGVCAPFTVHRYEKLYQLVLNDYKLCTLLSTNLSANSLTMGTTRLG